PLQDGGTLPVFNPHALGNAWMVDKVSFVDNADEEIDRTSNINLRYEAVADKKFAGVLGKGVAQDSTSVVTMTNYTPNELTYDINSAKGGIAVFSEIYYPGWTATIDGQAAELGRVDYVLRALNVPEGKHKVILSFKPKSIRTTETVAYVSYALLILALCGGFYAKYRKRRGGKDYKNAG
ncbi:MAG: YfhO family protein, partial [Prevotella sp.]|nr:YfhO family protein [Prevotella sp.]